jgi:aromatic-L-amino-acid decarboxylase
VTPEEFRKHGHAVVDWIADYRAKVAERPVMAQTAPGEIKARLPQSPPDQPEPF